jgi:hypothetical protein
MLSIEDLEFHPHKAGFQATAHFENGFGVSIIPETDMVSYEVAILRHENGNHSHVTYESGLTDDVFRYLSRDEVHDIVSQAQNLSPKV